MCSNAVIQFAEWDGQYGGDAEHTPTQQRLLFATTWNLHKKLELISCKHLSSGKLGQGARTKNALRLEVENSLQKVNRDNNCSLKKVNKARSKLIQSCDRCEAE